MKRFIYGLRDPRRDEIRYVGVADKPTVRKVAHVESTRFCTTPCFLWIQELRKFGREPEMVILEIVDADSASECRTLSDAAERKWIAHYLAMYGKRLLNVKHGHKSRRSGAQRVFCLLKESQRHSNRKPATKRELAWLIDRAMHELSAEYGVQ